MNVRRSKFDPRIIVCEVLDDNCPQTMLEGLDKRGLGFAIWGESIETPVVVIDNRSDMSEDHLLAIEAHEVGHILTCSEDEEDAELFGIALLRSQVTTTRLICFSAGVLCNLLRHAV